MISIGCYNQEEHGLKSIHDEEEITFDEMEVKNIIEFIPAVNKLLSQKLLSDKLIFFSDEENVYFAHEDIHGWLLEENNQHL